MFVHVCVQRDEEGRPQKFDFIGEVQPPNLNPNRLILTLTLTLTLILTLNPNPNTKPLTLT